MEVVSQARFSFPFLSLHETRPRKTYRGLRTYGVLTGPDEESEAGQFQIVVVSDPKGTRHLPHFPLLGENEYGDRDHWNSGYIGSGPHYTAYRILHDAFEGGIPEANWHSRYPTIFEIVRRFVQNFLSMQWEDEGFEIEHVTILRDYGHLASTREAILRAGLPASRLMQPEKPLMLTIQELHVLDLLMQGRGKDEVAAALVISSETAKSHIAAIFKKYGVRSHPKLMALLLAHPKG